MQAVKLYKTIFQARWLKIGDAEIKKGIEIHAQEF